VKWTRIKATDTAVARYTSGTWTIQNMGTIGDQSCRWILLLDGNVRIVPNGMGGTECVTGTLRELKDYVDAL